MANESNKTPHFNAGTNSVGRHTLMMVLCCVIPLVILGVLWLAGVSQNVLSVGILLLCPIMHLVIMKNMKHGTQNPESKIDENKKEELT
jgi:hypothetical protein